MTDQNFPRDAILYCRVSSVAQVEEGHGLESKKPDAENTRSAKATMSLRPSMSAPCPAA